MGPRRKLCFINKKGFVETPFIDLVVTDSIKLEQESFIFN